MYQATIRQWCTARRGPIRHIRRTTRSSLPATISAPRWPPGWHLRPARRSWAGYGVGRVPGGAAVTRTSTSIDTTTSTSIGRQSIQTAGTAVRGPAPCRHGHPADQWAFRAAGKSTYPAMRCGLQHARVGPAAWATSAALVGPVVWAVSVALGGRV